jgi:hypothetical protein
VSAVKQRMEEAMKEHKGDEMLGCWMQFDSRGSNQTVHFDFQDLWHASRFDRTMKRYVLGDFLCIKPLSTKAFLQTFLEQSNNKENDW